VGGEETISVSEQRNVSIGDNDNESVGKNKTVSVGGKLSVTCRGLAFKSYHGSDGVSGDATFECTRVNFVKTGYG
jgi:hypothetical protein